MTKCLITGHDGFIGRHLCAEAKARGWDVTGVDIVDGDDCRDFFAEDETPFDVVFHCAAIVGGRAKIDGDPLAVATNMGIDVDAFRWALRANVGRFVYWSSSAAYPTHLQGRHASPLTERDIHLDWTAVGVPDQTYGWAKLTGELLAQHARNLGLAVDIYRPFSGYGTDQDITYPFPAFIERARAHANPFEVWGDGTQTRDFIHVDDIVAAVYAGLEREQVGPVNLCTGIPTTFTELAAMVMVAAGYDGTIETHPDRPTGVHTRVGNPTAMTGLHAPTVTLGAGIRRAMKGKS